jgi:hypothetical protein
MKKEGSDIVYLRIFTFLFMTSTEDDDEEDQWI